MPPSALKYYHWLFGKSSKQDTMPSQQNYKHGNKDHLKCLSVYMPLTATNYIVT